MPKAKPVSLHPLSFDEAIKAILGVAPERKEPKKQRISKPNKQKKSL